MFGKWILISMCCLLSVHCKTPSSINSAPQKKKKAKKEISKKEIVSQLVKKFANHGSFRAEFILQGIPMVIDGKKVNPLVLVADLKSRKLLLGSRAKGENKIFWFMFFRKLNMYFREGSSSGVVKVEGAIVEDFFKSLYKVARHLDKLKGKGVNYKSYSLFKQEDVHPILNISLVRKMGQESKGNIEFGLGINFPEPIGASWFADILEKKEVTFRITSDRVSFHFPLEKKTIILDRKTGFIHSYTVENYDGRFSGLTLVKFENNSNIPKSPLPKEHSSFIIPIDKINILLHPLYQQLLKEMVEIFINFSGASGKKKDSKKEALRQSITMFALLDNNCIYKVAVASWIRSYLNRLIQRGIKAKEFKNRLFLITPILQKGFKKKQKGLRQYMEKKLEEKRKTLLEVANLFQGTKGWKKNWHKLVKKALSKEALEEMNGKFPLPSLEAILLEAVKNISK